MSDWLEKAAQSMGDQADTTLDVSVGNALDYIPDSYAQTQQSANVLNLPVDIADRQSDQVKKLASKQDILKKLSDTQYVRKAFEDPEFARIAHDDVEPLGRAESFASKMLSYTAYGKQDPDKDGKSLAVAGAGAAQATLGIAESIFRTPEALSRIDQYTNNLGRDLGLPEWMLQPVIPAKVQGKGLLELLSTGFEAGGKQYAGMSDVADQIGKSQEILAEEFETFKRLNEKGRQADIALNKAIKGDSAELIDVITDPEAWAGFIGQAAPSLYAAFKSGGSLPFIAWLESMEVTSSAAEFEKETGQKIDPAQYVQAVGQVAMINTFLERLGLDKVFGTKGGLSGFFKGAITEGSTEGLQQLNTNVAQVLSFNPDKALSEGVLGGIMGGVGSGGPVGALPSMAPFNQDAQKSRAAADSADLMTEGVQSAVDSQTRKRAPDKYREFLTDKLGVEEDVLLDASDAANFFQSNPDVMQDLQKKAPDLANDIANAIGIGSTVSIPMADYLTYLPEQHEQLKELIRNDADGMNLRESIAWQENSKAEFIAEAEKIIEGQPEIERYRESADQVKSYISDQIVQTGRFPKDAADAVGELWRSRAVAIADRAGILPHEVLEKRLPQVKSTTIEGQQLNQPDHVLDKILADFENLFPELANRPMTEDEIAAAERFENYDRDQEKSFKEAKDRREELNLPEDRGKIAGYSTERIRSLLERWVHADGQQTRARIAHIDPIDFVAATHPDVTKIESESRELDVDELKGTGTPYLIIETSGEIIGHEGRHRMMAMAKAGVKSVPVVISQPEYTDYEADLNLKGQSFRDGKGIDIKVNNAVPILPGKVDKFTLKDTELLFQENFDHSDQRILYQGEQKGAFSPDTNIIALLQGADLSTLLHESGHFFLEQMNDFAADNEVIAQDMDKLLEWFGVADRSTWNNMTLEEQRSFHEKFAEGFETYLFEGKSPNLEMQGLFQRFRSWLINAYKSMLKYLSPDKLTSEVRSVMDRMLATDEQIKQAEAARSYFPLFTNADEAAQFGVDWNEYQAIAKDATAEAMQELDRKVLGDMKWMRGAVSGQLKRLQREAAAKRKAVRVEVAEDLNDDQTYAAITFLNKNKLSIPALEQMYQTDVKTWRKLGNHILRREGGLHPDAAAAATGFDSGDQMIQAILDAPKMSEVIDRLTEQRMVERYGDIASPEALQEAAEAAIHNKVREKFALTEYNAMAKATGQRKILNSAAKEFADNHISTLRPRNIKPLQFLAAEAKAGREAAKAMARGDTAGAATHQRSRILNGYLYRSAVKAVTEIDKMVGYHNKFKKESIQKKVGQEYMDQIESIQQAYSFRKSTTLKAIDKGQQVRAWIYEQIEAEQPIMIPEDVIQATERDARNYKDVPLEELRGVTDAVKSLETVGRNQTEIKVNKRKMQIEDIVSGLNEQMQELPEVGRSNRQNPTEFEKIRDKMNYTLARLTKVGFITRWMDGDKAIGLAHDSIMQKANDAQVKLYELWEGVGKHITSLIRDMPAEQSKRWNQEFYIPEVDRTMKVSDMFMVVLNSGSESNLEKLTKGNKWDAMQRQAVTARLKKEDYDMAQEILNSIESLGVEMFDVAERVTGKRPKKVQPLPIQSPYGEYPGGYFPVKYDKSRSRQAAKHEGAAEDLIESGNDFLRANVFDGMTKGRTGFYDEIKLDTSVIESHLREVIMFISHYEAVRDLDAITRHPRFESQMKKTFGEGHWKELRQWVKDIATQGTNTAPKDLVTSMIGRLRMGTTIVAMGFKISTGLVQILGLSATMKEIGSTYMGKGILRTLGKGAAGMSEAKENAFANSQVLRHRLVSFDREVNQAFRKLSGRRGIHARISQASLYHIGFIQLYTVDLPSWWGAYEKGVKDFNGDHERSAKYADWVIENMQGSGAVKDMAGFVRDRNEYMRVFTMFYTYFSSMFANERDIARTIKAGDYGKAIGGIFFLVTLPVILESLMRGRAPQCDSLDKECMANYAEWLAIQHMTYPIQGVPIARDIASSIESGFDYNMNPVASTIKNSIYVLSQSENFINGDASDYAIRKSIETIGVLTKTPVGQFTKSGQYLKDLSEGDADASNPLEFMQELIYGEQKPK